MPIPRPPPAFIVPLICSVTSVLFDDGADLNVRGWRSSVFCGGTVTCGGNLGELKAEVDKRQKKETKDKI